MLLKELKSIFVKYNIDGYIVPKNDEHFSEYSKNNRLKKISNFTGSAGFALILKKINYLFVDGRYTIQSVKESGKFFKIIEIPHTSMRDILDKYKDLVIGYDPKIFTSKFLKENIPNECRLNPLDVNLIDVISKNKEEKVSQFYYLSEKITGENTVSKIEKLSKHLRKNKIDNLFISSPENVAWLLNLRGFDNPNSPVPNCSAIIDKFKKVYFFSDIKKSRKISKIKKNFNLSYFSYNNFFNVISNLKGINFSLDQNTCSNYFEKIIMSKFKVFYKNDPCYLLKSRKNKTEVSNIMDAHISDGVALTKFIYWIKKQKKNINEMYAVNKLENFRKKNKNYLYPSFKTIAGSGPNAAVIHYSVNKKTNREIKTSDIFLLDSGGQYKYGTTDVTRTICFKKPNKEIKDIYTRVLKGHISVVNYNLKKNTKGSQIDKVARKNLNDINLDYPHGTGHGVGYFLNVHEGPQALSKFNKVILKEGMVLSNEPGYYKKNYFGVRIENLIYIKRVKHINRFENLTLVPLEKDMINYDLLNNKEKKYLKNYHINVYKKLKKYLNQKEQKWLKSLI